MQLPLPLPAPRQPAPRPCPVRAALLRKIERKRALMHPADLICARLADRLFVQGATLSSLCQDLKDHPAARRWLTACEKAGLLRRVPDYIFLNNHNWTACPTARA